MKTVIGICIEDGIVEDKIKEKVIVNLQFISKDCNLKVYVQQAIPALDCIICNDPSQKMIDDYKEGIIDFIVRGINDDLTFQEKFKNTFRYNEIMRLWFVQDIHGREFGMGPISAGEGEGKQQRLSFVLKVVDFMKHINKTPRIAVMSRCRKDSQHRSDQNKESWEESEFIVSQLKNIGIESENVGIELEKAVGKYNYILMVNGLVGNQVCRTLIYLAKGQIVGAPAFALEDIEFRYCYEDNSRNETDYKHHVKAAI